MKASAEHLLIVDQDDPNQIYEPVGYDFGLSRRTFVQVLGAGLLIAVASPMAVAQERPNNADRRSGGGERGGRGGGGGGGRPVPIDARLHIAKDGTITVLCGKVEGGQGSRGQITQAAAEELRVPVEQIKLILADTAMTPDDGGTSGSRTTPSTVPAVRQACAAARKLLEDFRTRENKPDATYADLAAAPGVDLKQPVPRDVELIAPKEWKILGTALPRPNARDLVTGAHQYPSDIIRDDMLYAKVLRPPTYGATLSGVDLAPAQAMAAAGVVAVRDKDFVAVAAPTTHLAKQALEAVAQTAKWTAPPHPSSRELNDYLRKHASDVNAMSNPHAAALDAAKTKLKANYNIPYVQHAPMEPRAAVAEWSDDGKAVTVWTATQNPFRVRGEIAQAFHMEAEQVRVIIPDFGGAFGGKHTGECAVEAARIAKAAHKPIALRWTRAEEFSWAYFRPAAVMQMEAGLNAAGKLCAWHFVNINSGRSGIETPYRVAPSGVDRPINEVYIQSDPPLRHGSYRALAAVANHFARESFMNELAAAIKADPLEFRTTQLEPGRLRDVLVEAAMKFEWSNRWKTKRPENVGIGLSCGTEKGSFVATCAEVEVDRAAGTFAVKKICQAYDCGAITSPSNLRQQVLGGIIQALGPALREASEFAAGKITNASFWKYEVPRFADVPPAVDVFLIDRPDLPSVGAGETPLICVAPAIANAIFDACGVRLRDLPLKLPPAA